MSASLWPSHDVNGTNWGVNREREELGGKVDVLKPSRGIKKRTRETGCLPLLALLHWEIPPWVVL